MCGYPNNAHERVVELEQPIIKQFLVVELEQFFVRRFPVQLEQQLVVESSESLELTRAAVLVRTRTTFLPRDV